MSDKHTQGRLYIRTNRHPNTDGTPWGWVDLYEPGSMRQASPEGIQVTWSRGQTSEANARRLVACWNACEGIRTEALEHRSHMLKAGDDQITMLTAQRDELLGALTVLKAQCELMAASDWRKWEELASPEEFERWVKSRAAHMAVQATAAIAKAEASK